MRPRHRVTRAAIELIKRFEGYRRKAVQLPDGRWTVGYGHTLTARQGAEVSEQDAEALLLYDLIAVAHVVNEHTYTTLTPNQFDALSAFAFNIGLDNFRQSTVLKRVNEGALIQAAFAMELWRKAHFQGERIVVDALVRRRAAEKLLFLTPVGNDWTPAPSSILQPLLDLDGVDTTPRQTPTPLATMVDGEQVLLTREGETPAPSPPTPDEAASPLKSAAEEIRARLQTIYPEMGEPIEAPPADEPVRTDALIEAPVAVAIEEVAIDEAEPEAPPVEPVAAPADVIEDFGGSEPSPFARAANDLRDEAPDANVATAAEDSSAQAPADARRVIDDLSPFQFTPAAVQSLPDAPRDGAFTLVALAVVGLAFFGGGIFWAANARDARVGMLTPLGVGLLAGLAGIGFFCVAIYLLLQRLARAAERRGRNGRR
jgi:lysozyme